MRVPARHAPVGGTGTSDLKGLLGLQPGPCHTGLVTVGSKLLVKSVHCCPHMQLGAHGLGPLHEARTHPKDLLARSDDL